MSCCAKCARHGCACGCGARRGTPLSLYNRPGLARLVYRAGAYADFYETMKADLSDATLPALAGLRTRETDDPAMALIDVWSVGTDVLSFYQERIANEGYLRTAVERRSVLELARLVDYRLCPGVSASVDLAFTIDKDSAPVTIPTGTRAQSIPAPGEQMQSFETSEPLVARYEWNGMRPRQTRPQNITAENLPELDVLWLDGMSTGLKPNDRLLFLFGDLDMGVPAIRLVQSVEAQQDTNRTKVTLQPLDRITVGLIIAATRAITALDPRKKAASNDGRTDCEVIGEIRRELLLGAERPDSFALFRRKYVAIANSDFMKAAETAFNSMPTPGEATRSGLTELIGALSKPSALQPASRFRLARSAAVALGTASDSRLQLLLHFEPRLADAFYRAWTRMPTSVAPALSGVYALRLSAPLFGYNAPKIMGLGLNTDDATKGDVPFVSRPDGDWQVAEAANHVQLDNAYEGVVGGSYLVVHTPGATPLVAQARSVRIHPRTDYGISGKTTDITLITSDTQATGNVASVRWSPNTMATVRGTQVYAQSERLTLAEETIEDPIGHGTPAVKRITLDAAVEGFEAGRWVIIEGQRTDAAPGVDSVTAAELMMVEAVEQGLDAMLPGDTVHSTLVLADEGLAYTYKRETVRIYGNVVPATHGESRSEMPINGDAASPMQSFVLKQFPLTYVSAATPEGIASTLTVRVNGVEWHETRNLAFVGPGGRNFVTLTDDDAKTRVVLGDGAHGARLPTGILNVKAAYRNGIGTAGNVRARQISLITTRPPGVKDVINPIRASGGADAETRDQARRNVSSAVMALDRLVSVADYSSFARTFGGVGKAAAVKLGNQVHVTIAGAADAPIDTTSDLFRNLLDALRRYGDPTRRVGLGVRELLALTLSANVGLAPDYAWESVEPAVRGALLDRFGFENRELAQSAHLSEVIACIQAVRGVAWVDVDAFGSLDEGAILDGFAGTKGQALVAQPSVRALAGRYGSDGKMVLPAELVYLLPNVPDTLLLQEAKP